MSSPASDKIDAGVLKIASVVVVGAIMAILDITVVSVALPTFQKVFHTPNYATVAWTMTGYTLALATVIPLTGWAADRFGTKRLYMAAIIMFAGGSALCSTAWSIQALIGFRVLQGLGGGMLMPLGMTIVTHAAGPQRVGRVMAILGVPMLLGPIAGPILGGWLIEAASWHWIFLINLPIGVVALTMAVRLLPKDQPTPSESFDFVGMLLLSPGLALLLFGVSSVTETGTFLAARVLVPGLIGAALVAAFVFHAFRPEHPLIDLRLLRDKYMTVAVIAMSLFAMAFFGAGLLFPSYFLQARGETTLMAGLLVAPQGLGAMLSMPIAGTLSDKIGSGRVVIPGMIFICAGMAVFTQVGPHTSYWLLLGALFVMGLGMGATMMPIMSAALATLTHQQVARGSTLMNIIQQVAGAVGTATMSVILANQEKADPTALAIAFGGYQQSEQAMPPAVFAHGLDQLSSAFGFTFLIAVIVLAFTLVPAFLLPRQRVTPSDDAQEAVPMMVG